jgi:molybdenum cofactor cytidylyltransferase
VKPFAALILAGGFSRRMRQLKPLLTIGGGKTIADRLISTFQAGGAEVYLVVGHRGEEIKSGIKSQAVTIVNNPEYASGMFSSVQAGARALRPGYEAFFVMPVDMPLVSPSTIRTLISASAEHTEKILYPVFSGKRGHPPLIPISLATVIGGWKREGNLKEVLRSYENLAVEIAMPDEGILLDINTPDDYRLALERFGQG